MKITEIIEILRNDNTSYLWDLPKPKWEATDYYNLNQIKQGNDYKNKKKVLDFVELSDKSLKMQKVFFRSYKNSRWMSDLADKLPDDTKVYALTNSHQGVRTIADCKKILKEEL